MKTRCAILETSFCRFHSPSDSLGSTLAIGWCGWSRATWLKETFMRSFCLWVVSGLLAGCAATQAGELKVEQLDLQGMEQGWAEPQVNRSVDGHPIFLDGKRYDRGLGTHAQSVLRLGVEGEAERLTAIVGVDDEVGEKGSVVFKVMGDKRVLWESGVMKGGGASKPLDVPLAGVKKLTLIVEDAGDGMNYDHADWAEPTIQMKSGTVTALAAPREPAEILTPAPSARPRINGARVFGVRPGSPFQFRIPATGERPMSFMADGLPKGLQLDATTGIITGRLAAKGTFKVGLKAVNRLGTETRSFRIECGEKIALTPPMGWNSWNCFGCDVNEANVRGAADAMVASGLVDHGWTYVNIDDCWEASRDASGAIQSNQKFPDMKRLADYVHGQGLKIGLYSSPGTLTCASHEGSYKHEEQDARSYAEWGFDYLKYDWCSYGQLFPSPTLEQMKHPYTVMRGALDHVPRDIVYSLCQYGMGNVWEWGAAMGANCWRTTGDITDTWPSMSSLGFGQAGHESFAGPGHWNDPDMLVVGQVGWSARVRPTRLTPNEQYTHITLWAMLCSPLLIGCDMTRMDAFTLSLLTNDEVIEVNQDPLGRAAGRIRKSGGVEVWAKDMEDGSKIVALFNRAEDPEAVSVEWTELGRKGSCRVRDVWRQKDLGSFKKEYTAQVPRHGVVLLRVSGGKRLAVAASRSAVGETKGGRN
jgi:alpha-galactosidase